MRTSQKQAAKPVDLPSRRYALMLRFLRDELGARRGWQSAVARRLDVDKSLVSRIAAGDRSSVSAEFIQRAIERLRLDPEFFHGHDEPTALWVDPADAHHAGAIAVQVTPAELQADWRAINREARTAYGMLSEGTDREAEALHAMELAAERILNMPVYRMAARFLRGRREGARDGTGMPPTWLLGMLVSLIAQEFERGEAVKPPRGEDAAPPRRAK